MKLETEENLRIISEAISLEEITMRFNMHSVLDDVSRLEMDSGARVMVTTKLNALAGETDQHAKLLTNEMKSILKGKKK